MSTQTESKSAGLGFCSLLTLIFITLKLTNYITWSWCWVLAPLWIPLAVVISLAIIVAIWVGIHD